MFYTSDHHKFAIYCIYIFKAKTYLGKYIMHTGSHIWEEQLSQFSELGAQVFINF